MAEPAERAKIGGVAGLMLRVLSRPLWRGLLTLSLILSVLMSLWAVRGLSASSDLVRALAGPSEAYARYDRFAQAFSIGEADEVLLVRSDILGSDAGLGALEDLVLDLQFLSGVSQVVSLFTVPAADGTAGFMGSPAALAMPPEQRLAALVDQAAYADRLVAPEIGATLIHLIAQRGTDRGAIAADLVPLLGAVPPLDIQIVGQAEIDRTVTSALLRDQVVVTPLAILFCVLATMLALRSWRAAVACAVPPLMGTLWFLGLLSATATPLDPFLSVIPTILIVLGFADCMHLHYAIQRHAAATGASDGALGPALRETLPAAAMTSATSAMAFVAFAVIGTDALTAFAVWGPLGMVLVFLAFLLAFPVIHRALGVERAPRRDAFGPAVQAAQGWLDRPKRTTVMAGCAALALLPFLGAADPRFGLDEHVEADSTLGRGLHLMADAGLGNASLYLVVQDADGTPGLSAPDEDRLARAAAVIYDGPDTRSFATLLADRDSPFVAADGLSYALPVLLPLPLEGAPLDAEVAPLAAALAEAGLGDVTQIAGYSLLTAELVPQIIADMRLAFYLALGAVVVLVSVHLRSMVLGLIGALSSALPIVAVEAAMVLSGTGLTLTGAIAMTMAFGIAVDDTIHYLNRLRLARGDVPARLHHALASAGRPMIGTTVLLLAGLGATLFSAVPSLPMFGLLVGLALVVALIVDVLFLPAFLRLILKQ
ncbi:hypothetical protein roselon_02239 [Roseibacterium elongatum DSM 19469]|uniref:SSD domain-containing protein n=1 Tax=Roseicyclus elongatus DSM 19469 TaxID=1294273 RepID=W8S302_9RHOB|nr:hypothetical protein [Roseibacterium elongatum]AHM04577.1 hypothetical protein roselon_02239 [Roseibacterium elongatum DSM 19469]